MAMMPLRPASLLWQKTTCSCSVVWMVSKRFIQSSRLRASCGTNCENSCNRPPRTGREKLVRVDSETQRRILADLARVDAGRGVGQSRVAEVTANGGLQ